MCLVDNCLDKLAVAHPNVSKEYTYQYSTKESFEQYWYTVQSCVWEPVEIEKQYHWEENVTVIYLLFLNEVL